MIAAVLAAALATATPQPARPNIVFIVTDDFDADSASFLPQVQERIARAGATFTRAYASTPLCAPSRVALLTGRYPHNSGVVGNVDPTGGFGALLRSGRERDTVATRLKAAGYRTVLVGKYINEYPKRGTGDYVPPGWDEWYATEGDAPYFDFLMNENGAQRHYEAKPENYSTTVIREHALRALQAKDARDPRPVFLYVSTIAPHFPATPAIEDRGEPADAPETAPRPRSFNERDVSDKPSWVQQKPKLRRVDIRGIDKLHRQRMKTMMAVDRLVEAVSKALDASGEMERTYLFFTSDNGFELGHHRYARGKGLVYEESIRVPLFVRGPGVPAGSVRPHLVSHVDLLPTWLALAGAPADEGADGRSLMPLLGEAPPTEPLWRQDLLVEFRATDGNDAPPFHALRTPEWTYAEYDNGERELYDMRVDPDQLDNLAKKVSDAVLAGWVRRLEAVRRCSGRACP